MHVSANGSWIFILYVIYTYARINLATLPNGTRNLPKSSKGHDFSVH